MENYKEYKSRLFEAFMDAEYPREEVEYEEVEVEPIFLISEGEELTEENTAVIIEDDELSEELLNELAPDEKWGNFDGHQVIINKNTGVVKSGKYKGKKVNLVRDRQRYIKKTYKAVDKKNDNLRDDEKEVIHKNAKAVNQLKKDSKKYADEYNRLKSRHEKIWGPDSEEDKKKTGLKKIFHKAKKIGKQLADLPNVSDDGVDGRMDVAAMNHRGANFNMRVAKDRIKDAKDNKHHVARFSRDRTKEIVYSKSKSKHSRDDDEKINMGSKEV